MANIERSTISLPTAAVIVISVAGLVGNYFTTMSAVKTGIQDIRNETKLEIQDVRSDQKLMQKDINELENRTDKMERAAMTMMEAIKPEPPTLKRHQE